MGYFDSLADAAFKVEREGRELFCPWGVLGKSYIVPDTEKRQGIRRFLKRYYAISLPSIMATVLAFGAVYCCALVPALLLWYAAAIRPLLEGLEASPEGMSLGESYAASARAQSPGTLWIRLISSLILVLAGIWIVSDGEWLLGLSGILFFGACGIANGYMLKTRQP